MMHRLKKMTTSALKFRIGNDDSKAVTITKDDLEFVQNSWKVIMQNAEENGIFIFKTFLTKHNYYSYFTKFVDLPMDQLEHNQTFRNHAANIIQAIDNVILNLENEEVTKSELTALGKMHAKKKINEKQFQELKMCILEILETVFKLPDEVIGAWRKTLNNAFVFIFDGLNMSS